jgi:peptidoglycan hydrolase CwlO-like protein
MNLDERLEYIATLQQTHDEQIGRLVEQSDETRSMIRALAAKTDKLTEHMDNLTMRMDKLTERTIQAMDAINRLARIADNHEDRIGDLEDRRQ